MRPPQSTPAGVAQNHLCYLDFPEGALGTIRGFLSGFRALAAAFEGIWFSPLSNGNVARLLNALASSGDKPRALW
jgi:hypothetical protein